MRTRPRLFCIRSGSYTMTRFGSLKVTTLAYAGWLIAGLAFPAGWHKHHRAKRSNRTVRAPIGDVGMAAPSAPRAGSIDRSAIAPAYQQPPAEALASRRRCTAASNLAAHAQRRAASIPGGARELPGEQRDTSTRAPRRGSGRPHATVNRAAYQDTEMVNDIANTEEIIAPVGAPEDLPGSGGVELMPTAEPLPYGPLRYRRGPVGYRARTRPRRRLRLRLGRLRRRLRQRVRRSTLRGQLRHL